MSKQDSIGGGLVGDYERWVEAVWGDTGPSKAAEHVQHLLAESGGDSEQALDKLAHEFQDLRENFICTVGLCEEAGEVAGPVKKNVRNATKHPLDRDKIVDECGDVLYYLVKKLHSVDATLEEAMDVNMGKINARYGPPTEL